MKMGTLLVSARPNCRSCQISGGFHPGRLCHRGSCCLPENQNRGQTEARRSVGCLGIVAYDFAQLQKQRLKRDSFTVLDRLSAAVRRLREFLSSLACHSRGSKYRNVQRAAQESLRGTHVRQVENDDDGRRRQRCERQKSVLAVCELLGQSRPAR